MAIEISMCLASLIQILDTQSDSYDIGIAQE